MTQAFEIWYVCGGRVGGMDIFSGFVELSFPPLFMSLLLQLADVTINKFHLKKKIIWSYKKENCHIDWSSFSIQIMRTKPLVRIDNKSTKKKKVGKCTVPYAVLHSWCYLYVVSVWMKIYCCNILFQVYMGVMWHTGRLSVAFYDLDTTVISMMLDTAESDEFSLLQRGG